MQKNSISVMHLIDTLDAGGAERMAVNVANGLLSTRYTPHLCSTRREGVLAESVHADVKRLTLNRKKIFDTQAIRRLNGYIRENDIRILHAHSTSLFIAAIVSAHPSSTHLVWHDHWGGSVDKSRPVWLYWLATRRIDGVVAVSQPLVGWSQNKLKIPSERTRYVPNFVCLPEPDGKEPALPGRAGYRIVCVANIRPEKGQHNLLYAMEIIKSRVPDAHLLLVGQVNDPAYHSLLQEVIKEKKLDQHVTLLGQRQDVAEILRSCDIGVLSSLTEGLPLALLEYGAAGLPVVSTQVGQCEEVLEFGRAGLLVPPGDQQSLANALLNLHESQALRSELGERFNTRVRTVYGMDSAIDQICQLYEQVLSQSQ